MSRILTNLCSLLLREYFGEIVQTVGDCLLKQVRPCPLFLIAQKVSMPVEKVKTSLLVLIQHGFCNFEANDKGFAEYSMKHKSVLLLLYYERYAYYAHMLFGEAGELIVEEILNHGRLTMSETLIKVSERLQDVKEASDVDYSLKTIEDKFRDLVNKHFLIRCPYPHATKWSRVPNLIVDDRELFVVPAIKLDLLLSSTSEKSPAKKQKVEYPDSIIYWRVNHNKFNEHFRNEVIIQACANHMNEKAAEIVKTILTLSQSNPLSPTSAPIARHEILYYINKATNIMPQDIESYLDSYLSVLSEGDRSFVSKADDRGGGVYVVNIKKVLTKLVESIAASVVQDKFGSMSARIFRIILDKKVMDPKHVEDVAMLHPKDCKEYIFKMLKENFIITHDIPKGSDYSHGLIFYLLYINMVQVCHILLERCYQAVFNLMSSNEIHQQANQRLLEKKQRVDAIVASLKLNGSDEEQIQEVQSYITPPEEAVIKKVNACSQKIDSSIIQISEMILVLSIWLKCPK